MISKNGVVQEIGEHYKHDGEMVVFFSRLEKGDRVLRHRPVTNNAGVGIIVAEEVTALWACRACHTLMVQGETCPSCKRKVWEEQLRIAQDDRDDLSEQISVLIAFEYDLSNIGSGYNVEEAMIMLGAENIRRVAERRRTERQKYEDDIKHIEKQLAELR